MTMQPSGRGWKIIHNNSIPARLYVCATPCVSSQYHTSHLWNTSHRHEGVEKPVSIIPVTVIPVTVIPVTTPADVSTPLAAVFLDHRP